VNTHGHSSHLNQASTCTNGAAAAAADGNEDDDDDTFIEHAECKSETYTKAGLLRPVLILSVHIPAAAFVSLQSPRYQSKSCGSRW
jgi:hypothetical protein